MQSRPHLLADLVDLERLQHMCDSLSAASDMVLAVLDPGGAILVASGWQDICTKFHRLHEETLEGCLESDLQINRRLAEGADAPTHSAYRCANGLWDVAFPLIINGEHLANVFTGQFFYDDEIDTASFRERAQRLGFDEPAYLEALARVPVLSHERVERTIGFLADFVGMLADTGFSALQREREHEALRESEERYRQLFEAESDAVFLIDNETGSILEANSAASAMYGYSRDELLARTNEGLSAEPEKTQAVTLGTPVVADRVVTIPLRIHRKKDGSTFPVEITGRFFTHQGRAVHVAAIRDISGRKLTEEALRLSEDKFSNAFHSSPDAILITRVSDGLVTDVNDGFVRLSGFTRDEAVGSSTIALDLWPDPRDRGRMISALRSDGSVRDLEFDFRVKSGDELRCLVAGADIDVDGEPHILVVVRDVTEQRRVEAAVRRSEELLRGILDNLQDAYVRTGPNGRFIMVSPSAARLYGFDSADEMIGLPAESLYADRADREAMFEQLREHGHVVDYVGRGLKTDGSTFWVSLNAQSFLDETGSVAGTEGFIRDITERKKTEQALRESESRYRELVHAMSSAVVVYEATSDGQDFIIREFNQAAEQIEHVAAADVTGRLVTDAFPGVETFGFLDVFRKVWATGLPMHYPVAMYADERLTGWRENHVYRLPGGEVVAVYEDVGERVAAQDALAQAKELLDRTQAISKVGGWEYDVATDDLVWTDEVYRIHGVDHSYDPNDTDADIDFYAPDSEPIVREAFRRALAGGEPYDVEAELIRADSARIWVRTMGHPVIEDGAVVRVTGTIIDITERKRAEDEVQRLNDELEQRVLQRTEQLDAANKELESFAYSVSHDLRAPLRALDGFSQILLDDYGARLDDEGRSYLDRIRAADKRMGALIDALLELSRLNRGELSRERLNISKMARDVAAELAEAEPGRAVELAIADGLEAHADRRLVQALLANLLGNAWKFTARHETASIEVGVDDDGERAFYVRDSGAGFDMAYADKLFGAFQRLHSPGEFEGLGIGLATVQRIVRRHGGRVWAESEVEKGATFYFTLPETAGAKTFAPRSSTMDKPASVGEDVP